MTVADDVRTRIDTDPDYIFSRRFNYSLAEFQERYPEGAPNKLIAQALAISEEEVEDLYEQVIAKLRSAMKVEL
jgi:hypothetical protein